MMPRASRLPYCRAGARPHRRGRLCPRGSGDCQSELAAELAQSLLLLSAEVAEQLDNPPGVLWKGTIHDALALVGNGHADIAAILSAPFSDDQTAFFQIAHHHGKVAAGFQDLAGQIRK